MCESLRERGEFAFDIETADNGHPNGGLDPHRGELRLLQFAKTPDVAYIVDTRTLDRPSMAHITTLLEDPSVEKIIHNGKFDCKWAMKHLGADVRNVFDTFIVSRLLSRGDKTDRHGLGYVVERYLGRQVDKSEQRSDWGASELTEKQLEYAARDVCVLPDLKEEMVTQLEHHKLMGVAKLENDIVPAMAALELNGFYLNPSRWRQQTTAAAKKHAKLTNELQDMFYAGSRQTGLFGRVEIDLGSWQQVSVALKSLGVPMDGNSTNAEALEEFTGKFPVVDKLFEWREYNTQITRYGNNVLDLINPVTGRIHADFMQIEAPSGRMGCGKPNLQNIPSSDEYRTCFTAPRGKRLVVADYSQIELRVLAEYSRDKAMVKSFCSGADYHAATAAQVFGVEMDEVTPDQRSFAKRVNFGISYGAGPGRVAKLTGKTIEETEELLAMFFAALPDMDKYLRKAAWTTLRSRQSRTMSGRIGRWAHLDPEEHKHSLKNLGKNFPIQGTAADIFKRGLFLIHEALRGTSAKMVNLVHDEYVLECDTKDADRVAETVTKLAVQAGEEYIKLVPVVVDTKIVKEWSKE